MKQEEKVKVFPCDAVFLSEQLRSVSPGRGLAAPGGEVGSWNCALCRGFLSLM